MMRKCHTAEIELRTLVRHLNRAGGTLSIRRYKGTNPLYGPFLLCGKLEPNLPQGGFAVTGTHAFLLSMLRRHE